MTTWRDRAWHELHRLAAAGRPFTADDLIDAVGPPDPEHEANSRASIVGSLFNAAAREGLIETDGRVQRSRQPHRKGGAIRVWRGRDNARLF